MSPSFPFRLKPPNITMPSRVLSIAHSARPSGAIVDEGVIFSQIGIDASNMCRVFWNSRFVSIPPNK